MSTQVETPAMETSVVATPAMETQVSAKSEDVQNSPAEAPTAHEALAIDGVEDVIATADIQSVAASQDIEELEKSPQDPIKPSTEDTIREDVDIANAQSTNGDIVESNVAPQLSPSLPTNTSNSEAMNPEPSSQQSKTRKKLSTSSMYFLRKTMDTILASKEGKRKGLLKDVTTRINESLQTSSSEGVDPNAIFEPLRISCESQSITVVIQALDCLGKLIAVSFFDCPPPAIASSLVNDDENFVPSRRADAPTRPLMDRVIDTICACFQGEGTDEKVQLQIIKALLSAVLDEKEGTMVHQSPLLKAIRQTYNIFLLSRSTPTQSIAQGTLEQMVNAVFGRVKLDSMLATPLTSVDDLKGTIEDDRLSPSKSENDQTMSELKDDPSEDSHNIESKVTLDSFARRQSLDQIPDTNNDAELVLSHDEILVKDAFLIFRSMCKLSTKALAVDSVNDLKSHMVRSKLLSLHMISTILNRHIAVFLSTGALIRSSAASDGIQFMQATKQYLCHALSRNAVSHIPQVFEVSCEIFWRMIDALRMHLKKEIEVFMIEIYLPILEMKTSSYQQKLTFMNVLTRLCNNPRALVEVYLNYDCDRSAMDNIYER